MPGPAVDPGAWLAPTADQAPVPLLETSLAGEVLWANTACGSLLGRAPQELAGLRFNRLLTVGGRFFFETHCKPILAARGAVAEVALDVVAVDGARLPVVLYATQDAVEERVRIVLVTAFERRAADEELRRMRRRERSQNDLQALTARLSEQALRGLETTELHGLAAKGLAELLPADLVTVTEGTRLITTAGAGAGDPPSTEQVARDAARAVAAFAHEPAVQEVGAPVGAAAACAATETASLAVPVGDAAEPHGVLTVHRAGSARYNAFEVGAVQAVAGVLWTAELRYRDVQAAEHRALHDPLTGLPNRTLLADRLRAALRGTRRGLPAPAVLFLDLDDFKLVNDGLGHHAGDQLLQAVAGRLEYARPGPRHRGPHRG